MLRSVSFRCGLPLRILGSGVPLRCGVGGSLVSPGCKSNASGLLKRWVVVICVLSCISLSRRRPSSRSLQIVQRPLPRLRSGDNRIRMVGRNLFGFPSNVILIIRQFGLIIVQFRHIASAMFSFSFFEIQILRFAACPFGTPFRFCVFETSTGERVGGQGGWPASVAYLWFGKHRRTGVQVGCDPGCTPGHHFPPPPTTPIQFLKTKA